MRNLGSLSGLSQRVAKSIRAVADGDGMGRSHAVLNVCLIGVIAMNKSIRLFSFANASLLPAALAAAMLIASSRSASAEPASAAETERAA
jgi:hypothetical protein